MTSDFVNIKNAHVSDGYPIEIAYANSLNEGIVETALESASVVRYLIPARFNPSDMIYNSTGGDIKQLKAFMIVFTNSPESCVTELENWFKRVGYVTENDVIGNPPKAPWEYSTLNILRWFPVGGVEQVPEQYGNVWGIEQYILIDIL